MDIEAIGAQERAGKRTRPETVPAPEGTPPTGSAPQPPLPPIERLLTLISQPLTILSTIVVLALSLGGGAVELSSHLTRIDENQAVAAKMTEYKEAAAAKAAQEKDARELRIRDKMNAKIEHVQSQQSADEAQERDRFDRLFGHVTKTETDVEWIKRTMMLGKK